VTGVHDDFNKSIPTSSLVFCCLTVAQTESSNPHRQL
jgi:hypothetical protein